MAQKKHKKKVLDRPPSARLPKGEVFLPSGTARGTQNFISESAKLQATRHGYNIALSALMQLAEMGRVNALRLNKILIF